MKFKIGKTRYPIQLIGCALTPKFLKTMRMKRIFLFAACFLVASLIILGAGAVVLAQTSAPVVCLTDGELTAQIQKCKNSGLDYTTSYDSNKCKYVKCVEAAKQVTAEESNPQPTTQVSKPTPPTVTTTCPLKNELGGSADVCKLQGMNYEYAKDDKGCSYIKCVALKNCPDTSAEINKCKKSNQTYAEFTDENGCKKIQCGKEEGTSVTCKKSLTSNGCIQIKCDDNYFFDSCSYQTQCRVDCKSYTDQDGCFVKTCSDGSEKKDCPKKAVACEVIKTNEGCDKKICTDGYEAISCPPKEKCKTYKDDNGCQVKECEDGYKNRECPQKVEEKELECKVYTDDRNCKVKVCSNGVKIDYCAQPSCKVETDKENCQVKKCDDGFVSRECPNKESIECQVITDKQTNCVVKKCSNGYESKDCPAEKKMENVLPSETTGSPSAPAEIPAAGTGIFNSVKSFMLKIFKK